MKKAKCFLVPAALCLLAASTFLNTNTARGQGLEDWAPVEPVSVKLAVVPIEQSRATSCGEAAIAMAHNYAYPGAWIGEEPIVEYAEQQGLYTPDLAPFTSPADMVAIAEHFVAPVYTGNVQSEEDGLWLLEQQLKAGTPVIIDVTTLLYDLSSGAHFILVTGVTTDPAGGDRTVTFNNPLTGEQEAAEWGGNEGIWNAWQNNDDPGGSGWWLIIPSD